MRTYWHVAHPSWTPGSDLVGRDELIESGADIPWLWGEAEEGTDGDRVSLFRDDEEGRQYLGWLAEDRPDFWVLRVELTEEDYVEQAEWEPMVATVRRVPADRITIVRPAS